jgi:hypothetical protein
MLSGMVPSDGSDPEDLRRRLLAGRYAEVFSMCEVFVTSFTSITGLVESAS